jgi:hypothetical protein
LIDVCLSDSSTTFLGKLDLMKEAAGVDSMTFGAVSFAELLGYCGEALKVYQRHADAIQARLASFGPRPSLFRLTSLQMP